MIKFIIFLIIFSIYSIIIFLCGRGYGIEETSSCIKNLKHENMMLKNDLSLRSIEDNKELQSHIDWVNKFNKNCSEEC